MTPTGNIGVYVHFPWCLSKCPYCDFVAYGVPRESIDHAGYGDAVVRELSLRSPGLGERQLATVFFGGGTPSLWDPREVGRVLRAIRGTFAASEQPVEVTLECDPSSLDYDLARAFFDVGINRLSIGVQSLDDDRLRFLGRIHTSDEATAALRGAVRAGGLRISTDLIYAVAEQTAAGSAAEARALVDLGATHVSAYSLTIEQGTEFGRLARRGRLPLADEGAMAASFFAIDDELTSAGLEHYEISNYAAARQRARHNVGYWKGTDYLGLGCGAYGTLATEGRHARRYRNPPRPSRYLSASLDGSLLAVADEERLDPPTRLRERIMLGLRTSEGLDLEAAAAELGVDAYPGSRKRALEQLEARGRIARDGGRLRVPRDAWIWVDGTASALF